MKKLVLQRIGTLSALKFGCALGALANLLPGILIALIAKLLITGLRVLLEGWQNVEMANVLGQSVRVNVITALKLDSALKTLQDWDGVWAFILFAIIFAWMLLGGVIVAGVTALLTSTYNLAARFAGGIEIELRERAPAGHTPPARLLGAHVPANGFVLRQATIRVGSDPANTLVLASPGVAPVHAEIYRLGERWIVRDLGSPNGTFVNDRAIRENMLKDGFRVRFGDVELTFRSTQEPA